LTILKYSSFEVFDFGASRAVCFVLFELINSFFSNLS
jgi:hypothetical protein